MREVTASSAAESAGIDARRWLLVGALTGVALLTYVMPGMAEEAVEAAPATAEQITEMLATPKVVSDTLWVMITAMLVFFMNLGFAMVESGLCRAKNAVNIHTA